jgi:hypothetical protein
MEVKWIGEHVNVWDDKFTNRQTPRIRNKTFAYLQVEQHTAHETETEKTVLRNMLKSLIKHQNNSNKTLLK